jgi:hypothetical protein
MSIGIRIIIYRILFLSTLFVKKLGAFVNQEFLTFFYIFFIFWSKIPLEKSDRKIMTLRRLYSSPRRATFLPRRSSGMETFPFEEISGPMRPGMVARGEKLLKRANYPGRRVTRRLAEILACRMLAE